LNAALAVAQAYKPFNKRIRDNGLEYLHSGLGRVLLRVEKSAKVLV
jgi:hypothetical protein